VSGATHDARIGAPAGPREGALVARDVSVRFGGLQVLEGVNLEAEQPRIVGLIGPNGAGKTTLINVLSGFIPPSSGAVLLDDREITRWPVARRARSGLTRTFQGIRLFSGLTVLENVEVACLGVGVKGVRARSQALEILDRVGLRAEANERGGSLPHGKRRLVGLARVLATRPRFVLLDEPAAGLDEAEVDQLLAALLSVRQDYGVAMLVVEHDMRLIMNVCEWIYVLDHGSMIAVGRPEELRENEAVLAAYLGTKSKSRQEHAE
jgi:ABC-type branched-subunit amino acid transport system ATPase component